MYQLAENMSLFAVLVPIHNWHYSRFLKSKLASMMIRWENVKQLLQWKKTF